MGISEKDSSFQLFIFHISLSYLKKTKMLVRHKLGYLCLPFYALVDFTKDLVAGSFNIDSQ